MPFDPAIDPEDFAKLTEGFTGAELTSVCQNAALKVIERDINCRKVILIIGLVNFHFNLLCMYRFLLRICLFVFLNLRNSLIQNLLKYLINLLNKFR